MRRLFDIAFFFAIALACVGVDFYIQKRDRGADGLSVAEYIALRKGDIQDTLRPPSLAKAFPTDVAGWTVTQSSADKMLPGSAAERAEQASEIALVKAVAALEKSASPAGEMVGVTMTKGDTRLRVLAVLQKHEEKIDGIETAALQPAGASSALSAMFQNPSPKANQAIYTVVDGVSFEELPASKVTKDPSLRMMRAKLGKELSVTVVTKSTDDAAIREALQAIDFVMLNKLLHKPVFGVAEGRTTDLRADPEGDELLVSAQTATAAAPVVETASEMAIANGAVGQARIAPEKAKPVPANWAKDAAEFIAPPEKSAVERSAPCVRRSGILICPDG